jgi:hypothetical protein
MLTASTQINMRRLHHADARRPPPERFHFRLAHLFALTLCFAIGCMMVTQLDSMVAWPLLLSGAGIAFAYWRRSFTLAAVIAILLFAFCISLPALTEVR